ncbi:MAG TPA: isocitrate/isopropylmalate family dehydrogenase, partial [Gaiellaceae bacterium]|nr:isocitrate/isopropylmalate family dehydrogenase [Gaiellaceae bacterium]
CVLGDAGLAARFEEEAARHDTVLVERLPVAAAAEGLAFTPERFDVVVAPGPLVEALAAFAARGRTSRVAASGQLAASGPSVFTAVHGPAREIAGQGVANPASLLLAAALMLAEGLGERRAAETLEGAVLAACGGGARTPRLRAAGVGATTRELGDGVLAELPFALTNAEFFREAVA